MEQQETIRITKNVLVIPAGTLVKALFDFQGDGVKKITLQAGDRLVAQELCKGGWARGKNLRDGTEGFFPFSFVQMVDEDDGGSSATSTEPVEGEVEKVSLSQRATDHEDEVVSLDTVEEEAPPVVLAPPSKPLPVEEFSRESSIDQDDDEQVKLAEKLLAELNRTNEQKKTSDSAAPKKPVPLAVDGSSPQKALPKSPPGSVGKATASMIGGTTSHSRVPIPAFPAPPAPGTTSASSSDPSPSTSPRKTELPPLPALPNVARNTQNNKSEISTSGTLIPSVPSSPPPSRSVATREKNDVMSPNTKHRLAAARIESSFANGANDSAPPPSPPPPPPPISLSVAYATPFLPASAAAASASSNPMQKVLSEIKEKGATHGAKKGWQRPKLGSFKPPRPKPEMAEIRLNSLEMRIRQLEQENEALKRQLASGICHVCDTQVTCATCEKRKKPLPPDPELRESYVGFMAVEEVVVSVSHSPQPPPPDRESTWFFENE